MTKIIKSWFSYIKELKKKIDSLITIVGKKEKLVKLTTKKIEIIVSRLMVLTVIDFKKKNLNSRKLI